MNIFLKKKSKISVSRPPPNTMYDFPFIPLLASIGDSSDENLPYSTLPQRKKVSMQCNAMCNPTKSHHMTKKLTRETTHRNAITKKVTKKKRVKRSKVKKSNSNLIFHPLPSISMKKSTKQANKQTSKLYARSKIV